MAFNKEVYERYGLLNLPRKFGFPVQLPIQSINHLIYLIEQNDGKFPLYISANANNGNYVNLGQIYFDLDGHGFYTMEDAFKEERKLAEYFEEQKVDFLMDMTGRGFRLLLKVNPDIISVNEASLILKGYTKHVRESLNLKTIDMHVAEPLRIMRPPLTTYIYSDNTKTLIKTKRHVLPIDMETLFNSDLDELLYKSENLEFHVSEIKYRRMDLSDVMEYKDTSSVDYVQRNHDGSDIDFSTINDAEFVDLMREIYRNIVNGMDMGADEKLIKNLLEKHPNHTDRFLACVKLKESVFAPNFKSALSFFDKLSAMAQWDNRNLEIQEKQIRSIYNGRYGVKK